MMHGHTDIKPLIIFLSETFTHKNKAGSLFGKSLILHYVETVFLMFVIS